jgi:uncharacterized protein YdgA (DUF945 family)
MRIRTLALGFAVVVAGAYAGATYHHSSKAEASALNWSQRLSQASPFLKVASSDYQRGFLRSTQNITIELAPVPGVGGKIPSVTLRNVIYHGPLPGFSSLGIARIDHSLVFDEATAKELAKVFGDVPPLTAVTTVNLAGEGSTELKGAPANYKSDEGGIAWQGLTGTMRFAKDMSSYSAEITAPGMLVSGKDGGSVSLKALSLKMNQARMANTENLYLGTTSMGIEALSLVKNGKPEFDMRNVAMSSDVSSKIPEFVDVVGRIAAGEVRSTAFSATDAEYAFSATHLHAQSLDKLSKAMQDAQQAAMAKGAQGAPGPAAQIVQSAMMQAMATHGLALLQRDPVFAIDRIGFVSKEGETKISGSARLVGVGEADMQNPLNLIAKVQADATIKVSEAIVGSLMAGAPLQAMKAQGREPSAEEIAQMTAQTRLVFEQKLAELVEKGYVVRENGILSSKLAFKDGQFMVNDKPFNPMGQAPQ